MYLLKWLWILLTVNSLVLSEPQQVQIGAYNDNYNPTSDNYNKLGDNRNFNNNNNNNPYSPYSPNGNSNNNNYPSPNNQNLPYNNNNNPNVNSNPYSPYSSNNNLNFNNNNNNNNNFNNPYAPNPNNNYPQNNNLNNAYNNNNPQPINNPNPFSPTPSYAINEMGYNNNNNNFQLNQNFIPREQLEGYLAKIDQLGSQQCSANVYGQWEYETNINEATQLNALAAQQHYAGFQRELWELLKRLDENSISDIKQLRTVKYLKNIGVSALPADQYDRYHRLISEMIAVFDQASICLYNEPFRCGLRLSDLTVIMARSRDWDELQHTWLEWRRRTGQYLRDFFDQLVDISNEAAKQNNFTDAADMWNFGYESPSFQLDIEDVWRDISPVFEQLHAYVRRKLRDLYGPERISRTAPLPAHVLGNMWAQSWTNIIDVTIPYPGKNFLDTTPNMQIQGYTPATMLQLAEEFYLSMNLTVLPQEFWTGSIIVQPTDRIINCQASAWDFCNGQDYRLKMCGAVTMKDFITMHHELAHIHYFLQYRQQPKVFRDGANPGMVEIQATILRCGFHEAIGEAIALSVGSPTHLQKLGLIQSSISEVPLEINYLFSIAMDKLPFLPFSFVMDKWRWDVFKKQVSREQYNCHWHELRERYLGVKPPILRSGIDFDPGSKYHIPANIPYIRYFVGTVLQFQLHRHLCRVAGQYDPNDISKPLHRCDIYRSKEAGQALSELMKYGSSVPWQEVLFRVTGENRLDGSAVRDFFRPLEDWLRNENLRTQEYPGWVYDGDYCKFSIETAGLYVRGGYYNTGTKLSLSIIFLLAMQILFLINTV